MTPHQGKHISNTSFSAPSSLISGSRLTRSEFVKSAPDTLNDCSSSSSLWEVIRSQQRQISELQRKVSDLSSAMGDLQATVTDRVCTPSICDSDEYPARGTQQSAKNYRAMRNDYLRFAGSFLTEWESLRKSKLLALPGPSNYVQEISDEESSCAPTPRAGDDYSARVHRLIRKYTT